MRRLIAFDLDGTLIDSRLDLAESANALLDGYGARPLEADAVAAMVGDGARKLVERVLDRAALRVDLETALTRFLDIYDQRLLHHTQPYPGISDALASVHGRASLAILTNKPEAPTRVILEALALGRFFEWVIGGDGAFPRKPHPAALEHLMSQACVDRHATLFVGDSAVDIETARRAHVPVCAAMYGMGHFRGPLPLKPDDLRARSGAELGQILQSWVGPA